MEKFKNIILFIIAGILVVLIALLINYSLADNSELNNEKQDNEVKDNNNDIYNASYSKTLNYKDKLNCTNIETNKGCVIKNGDNELVIYNESISEKDGIEEIKVVVTLNGNRINILNNAFKVNEFDNLILNKNGVFASIGNDCNKSLEVVDLMGNKINNNFGEYNLCKVELVNEFVNLTTRHKNITSDDYLCNETELNDSNTDAYVVSEGRIENNNLSLIPVSTKKFNAYCIEM